MIVARFEHQHWVLTNLRRGPDSTLLCKVRTCRPSYKSARPTKYKRYVDSTHTTSGTILSNSDGHWLRKKTPGPPPTLPSIFKPGSSMLPEAAYIHDLLRLRRNGDHNLCVRSWDTRDGVNQYYNGTGRGMEHRSEDKSCQQAATLLIASTKIRSTSICIVPTLTGCWTGHHASTNCHPSTRLQQRVGITSFGGMRALMAYKRSVSLA